MIMMQCLSCIIATCHAHSYSRCPFRCSITYNHSHIDTADLVIWYVIPHRSAQHKCMSQRYAVVSIEGHDHVRLEQRAQHVDMEISWRRLATRTVWCVYHTAHAYCTSNASNSTHSSGRSSHVTHTYFIQVQLFRSLHAPRRHPSSATPSLHVTPLHRCCPHHSIHL